MFKNLDVVCWRSNNDKTEIWYRRWWACPNRVKRKNSTPFGNSCFGSGVSLGWVTCHCGVPFEALIIFCCHCRVYAECYFWRLLLTSFAPITRYYKSIKNRIMLYHMYCSIYTNRIGSIDHYDSSPYPYDDLKKSPCHRLPKNILSMIPGDANRSFHARSPILI